MLEEVINNQHVAAFEEIVGQVKNLSRDYYKIIITGQNGNGKTYSFRRMNRSTTGFINIEDKPLPFKDQFKYHARPVNIASVMAAIDQYANNPEITCIVIESFSAYIDMLLAHARACRSNYEVWNLYNEEIGRFFTKVKKIKKEVLITAHYEMLNIEGVPEKRVKVKGKEWEGFIEKEVTIVLYADSHYDEHNKPHYLFRLRGQGLSAKCPPAIFGEEVDNIPNDSQFIIERILDFVN